MNTERIVPLDVKFHFVVSVIGSRDQVVTADEKHILFTSLGRRDDKGTRDIYLSTKNDKGNWVPARNVWMINSERLDYCPFVSFDNKTLFFTSERHNIPDSFTEKQVSYEKLKTFYNQVENGTGNIYKPVGKRLLKACIKALTVYGNL